MIRAIWLLASWLLAKCYLAIGCFVRVRVRDISEFGNLAMGFRLFGYRLFGYGLFG